MNRITSNYQSYTDKELLALIRIDDEAAFSEIFERYWDKILVVSYNRIAHMEEAEECVQDTLHRLWVIRKSIDVKNDDLSAYLSVAVRNQVFNRRLKLYRERLRSQGYKAEEITNISPEVEFITHELQQQIDHAINALPYQCRIVFEMSKKDGMSYKQISEKLNISENTVKYHLKKAHRDIRQNIDLGVWLVMLYYYFNN